MEFWGVEVKAGEKLQVQPEFGQLIHISQASLGEVKDVKGAKSVPLRVKIDNKSFIIGTLSAEARPQLMFDLVFERDFELSHDWKNGSIYFIGYIAEDPISEDDDISSGDDESEDDLVLEAPGNGFVSKAEALKPAEKVAAVAAKAGAKGKAKKAEEQDSDDDDDSEFDSDDEMALDGTSQIDTSDVSEDDSDDEDEDESVEELPKVQQSKKRPAESAEKTPLPKKAKSATPDKSGKKNATPAPSKSAGKTPNKSKEQTPKSAGQLSCNSCTKTFSSEVGLQSHSKAKHGGK